MASHEPNSLYRLASFADSLLLPAAELPPGTESIWTRGRQIEAFLWLDLGVKIGVFPEEPAQALAVHAAPPVQAALEIFEQRDIGALIPDHLRQMLRRSLSTQTYFVREDLGYLAAPDFSGIFDTFLLNAVVTLRDKWQDQFFGLVHSPDNTLWERAESDQITPEMIVAFVRRDLVVDVSAGALLTSLFTHCSGHWLDTSERLLALADAPGGDRSARIGFAGDLAAIQSWRFGFSSSEARRRMMITARRSLDVMRQQAIGSADDEDGERWDTAAAQAVEQFDQLMYRWEEMAQPMRRFAGA